MDVKEAIQSRRSVRKYVRKPIAQAMLDELLEAARLAPSGANRQPWQMVVVTDDERLRELVPICKNQDFVGECAAFFVGIDDPQQKWSRVDVTIAMDHISLAAQEMGLGTCWIGAFDQAKLADFLGLPKERVVTVCMTVGYPEESPAARSRKPKEELFFKDRYGGS